VVVKKQRETSYTVGGMLQHIEIPFNRTQINVLPFNSSADICFRRVIENPLQKNKVPRDPTYALA